LKDDDLKKITRELAESIKRKATLDWTPRDTVCADMRRTVRRLLARYGYPPDAQEAAHGEQCYEWDLVVDEWGYEVARALITGAILTDSSFFIYRSDSSFRLTLT